jgi:hypothetical protein
MNPYREVGRVATGERFIGREALVRQVAVACHGTGRPSNMRVVGHHRVGKTSLVRRALETIPPRADLVKVWVNVGSQKFGIDLFRSMVRQVLSQIGPDGKLEAIAGAVQAARAWYDLVEGVRAFFAAVRSRGLHVLVVLDEFDRAAAIFTLLAEFQLLRELASEPAYSVGLVTISRQNIEKIETQAAGGSILGGVVSTTRYVGMFTDTEVDLMLARAAAEGIGLAVARDEIMARTGPHPYLLELLCHRIVEIFEVTEKIDVATAFLEESPIIESYFNRLLTAVNADTDGRGLGLLRGLVTDSQSNGTRADLTRMRLTGIVSEQRSLFSPEFGRYILLNVPG